MGFYWPNYASFSLSDINETLLLHGRYLG